MEMLNQEVSTPPVVHTPTVEYSVDDQRLEDAQKLRHRILHEANRAPSILDLDPKTLKVVLSAAKDSDSQIQTSRRMEVDTNNMQLDREIALAIARRKEADVRSEGNPFARKALTTAVELSRDKLPDVPLVPGELDVGTSSLTYKDFIATVEGEGS
jgi:hypothetical protein